MMKLVLGLLASMALTALAGCGGVIVPPPYVRQPVTVYVKLDARHSGIVLPREGSDRYVEYSFGAWRWFALADTRWPVAFGSLLGFMQSTLQSNEYGVTDGRPAAPDFVQLIPITVDRARVEALRMELDARFARNAGTFQYNQLYDMYFVHDREHYHVFNNCNQVTARWLRRLGCRVEGLTLTNEFRVTPPSGTPGGGWGEGRSLKSPKSETRSQNQIQMTKSEFADRCRSSFGFRP